MTLSLEGWLTNSKEPPLPHEVRLALLETKQVFNVLGKSF